MLKQSMRMAIAVCSALHLGLGLGWAQSPASDAAAQGLTTCQAVMTGQHGGAPEGARQRHYAQAATVDTGTLCQCVAPRFAQGMAAKPAPDEAKLLERSIAACLPHLGSLSRAAQQSVLEGPLAAQEPTPAQLAIQTQRCRDMAHIPCLCTLCL